MQKKILNSVYSNYCTVSSRTSCEENVVKHLVIACKLETVKDDGKEPKLKESFLVNYPKTVAASELRRVGAIKKQVFESIKFEDQEVKSWALEIFEECKDRDFFICRNLSDLVKENSLEELQNALLEAFENFVNEKKMFVSFTPRNYLNLVKRLLDIKASDNVLDLCSGVGTFLNEIGRENDGIKLNGIEISEHCIILARACAEIFGNKLNLVNANVLDSYPKSEFDKVLVNSPLGSRALNADEKLKYILDVDKDREFLSPGTSEECLFVDKAIKSLKENGKAVSIVTNAVCFATPNIGFRKYLVEKGYLETVIAMAPNLYTGTALPLTVLVLSKGNSKVRFIDASTEFKKERRSNDLSEQNLDNIIRMLSEDSKFSVTVSNDEILQNEGISLQPMRYLPSELDELNEQCIELTELKSYQKSLTSGTNITATQLDNYVSQVPTKIRYLQTKDVLPGASMDNMIYMNAIDKKWEKSLVKDGDLIISRTSNPIRVAVASIKKDEKVVLSSNLYAITLKDGVSAYALKAFLESKFGQKVVSAASSGMVITMLSKSSVENLAVPKLSSDEFKQIENEYLNTQKKISELESEIASLKAGIGSLFEKKS